MMQERLEYWSLTADELLQHVKSSPGGLGAREAAERQKRFGPNRVSEVEALAVWRLIARQIASPLVLILLFGAIVSMGLGDWLDAIIIFLIVLGSALLGFWQEHRASAAVSKLRQRLALTISVSRAGAWLEAPVASLVPGDVIRLSAGNLVPADAVLLEARDFLVSESALTGESFPVEKRPGPVGCDAPLSERLNCIFLGTSVRSGTAKAVVVRTGPRTELGRIAGRLQEVEPETEFAHGLRSFGHMLTGVMVVVSLFVLVVNILFQRPPVESLLFAVALAVGLSPELLPAIVSVTLSAGARRLAASGVIVRRLEAIENLGSIDVLCTDKTGTLTRGQVELSASTDVLGRASPEVLRLAFLNASLETGITNPLDAAIVVSGERSGLDAGAVRKLDEVPYDFLRKRLTIVIADEKEPERRGLLITKGAVPNVLACCSLVERDGIAVPVEGSVLEGIEAICEEKGRAGYRILAVAKRSIEWKPGYDRHDERDMTLVGLLLFRDPLKAGIAETVGRLKRLGIAIKIITGDNRHTATHVADAIGLNGTRLMTGAELGRTRDEALWHLAERTDVFAEVDPQQKERIIRALQKRGHAVGYMGDGINDAPALIASDVGISVDQAVDVARESADIVLLRPDLDVLGTGVLDGRRTFANTLKYIKITVSANFGNMISMAIATLWLPFLPLAAKQILLNNFLSDFPSLAISTDEVDPDALVRAQRWSITEVRSFMIVFGLISSAFDLLTFWLLRAVFGAGEALFQSSWFVVSLLTELIVVLILRTRLPAWRSRPSLILIVSTIVVSCVAILLPYLAGVSRLFGLVPIPATLLGTMLAVVLGYAVATEMAKQLYQRRERKPRRGRA